MGRCKVESFEKIVTFVRDVYGGKGFIPLHEPCFIGNEKKYLSECIDSTFVSSVGEFVDKLEKMIADYTGASYAVATASGTSALHASLILAGVQHDDEVITQPLTFVATCNAISYCNAQPVFVDVDRGTMGMSPEALEEFLVDNTDMVEGQCVNRRTNRIVRACMPMHTFGHPCRIDEIFDICQRYGLVLIEDAAESFGSRYKDQHTGTFGALGVISFNGNKIITAGGGGCILTDDRKLAERAKHITTTAKIPHKWEYKHDVVAYNYRLPNLNAALLCAQLENVDLFLDSKRGLAQRYEKFFESQGVCFVVEPMSACSNYWLNAVVFSDREERDDFLAYSNAEGVMTRPIWDLMNRSKVFKGAQSGSLINAEWLEERVVNLPSSVLMKGLL